MVVVALEHFTILTDALDKTVEFYRTLLGLEPGWRPAFPFPGAWLYCGGRPVLHIVAGRSAPTPAGAIDHVAFAATGLAATLIRLEALAVAHELRRLPGDGVWQLFLRDPNGARIELDFAADEVATPATAPAESPPP
jgi:catechol 2,3-dioxygenase-like lactoylglutathione lyase family enzyme